MLVTQSDIWSLQRDSRHRHCRVLMNVLVVLDIVGCVVGRQPKKANHRKEEGNLRVFAAPPQISLLLFFFFNFLIWWFFRSRIRITIYNPWNNIELKRKKGANIRSWCLTNRKKQVVKLEFTSQWENRTQIAFQQKWHCK